MENKGGIYSELEMDEITINRGAIRYPANHCTQMDKTNRDGSYQALRSRNFINSIFSYSNNRNCLISPYTESITSMIPTTPTAYPSVLATKQHPDVGLKNQ